MSQSLENNSGRSAGGSSNPADEDAAVTVKVSGDDINLLDLLILLAKGRRWIIGLPLATTAIAAIVAFLIPNTYTATAVLMPPQQQGSSAAAMLGQLGMLAGFAPASLGVKNPNDLYVGILKSRTIADRLIERFNLKQLYDMDTLVQTRRELAEKTSISTGKEGLVQIEVDDHDPKRAADIANAYVEQLEKLTSALAVTEAAQRRLFFSKQVAQAKEDLAKAELAFKAVQEKTGLVQLDQQGRAMIEAVATLRARIVSKEVELSTIRTFATEQNPDLKKVQQELVSLRAELRKLERQSGVDADLLVGTRDIPAAGLEYARSYRDLKYAETMFELMAKQYELARVEEVRDAATVQIVDSAIPPDEKSKPRRALMIAITGFITAVLTLLGVLILGTWIKLDNAEDELKLATLKKMMNLRDRRSRAS
jgi:tyrosine-protein kinase Etk/Wzc